MGEHNSAGGGFAVEVRANSAAIVGRKRDTLLCGGDCGQEKSDGD
jgi:hypothetical protein